MKLTLVCRSVGAVLACAWLAAQGTSALAATTEPMDLDADILAEIAKEKARANSLRRGPKNEKGESREGADKSKDCGSINIGNVVGNRNLGFAPVDVNVIVVGDILNVNNKCK
jgi:hypothetical protein